MVHNVTFYTFLITLLLWSLTECRATSWLAMLGGAVRADATEDARLHRVKQKKI